MPLHPPPYFSTETEIMCGFVRTCACVLYKRPLIGFKSLTTSSSFIACAAGVTYITSERYDAIVSSWFAERIKYNTNTNNIW